MFCGFQSSVSAQNTQNTTLDSYLRERNVNRFHLSVGRLQPDHGPFNVVPLQGGLTAAHESDDNLPLARSAGVLYQHIIAIHDVLVAHGIPAHLECKNLAVSNDVTQRDAFVGLRRFDR